VPDKLVAAEGPLCTSDEQPAELQPVLPDKADMEMSLSHALLLLRGDDSTNVSASPSMIIEAATAEVSNGRIPSKSSQSGKRKASIHALELPVLPGDTEGFTLTATEETIGRAMGPNAMGGTMRLSSPQDTPSSSTRPLSARGMTPSRGHRVAGKLPTRSPQGMPQPPHMPQPPLKAWSSTGHLPGSAAAEVGGTGTVGRGGGSRPNSSMEGLRSSASSIGPGMDPPSPDTLGQDPGSPPPPPAVSPELMPPRVSQAPVVVSESSGGADAPPADEAEDSQANFQGTLQNLLESVLET